eukprot:Skav232871  [mRNA]  locus=scaffold1881:25961:36237:+ [translate_table: standard]
MRVPVALVCCTLCHGWWWDNSTARDDPVDPWGDWLKDRSPRLAEIWMAADDGWKRLRTATEGKYSWTWDQGLWWLFDAVVGTLGWMIFGSAWSGVQSGLRRLLQLGALLFVCLAAHYIWTVCYPIVSLAVGLLMAIVWLCRKVLRIGGTCLFYVQKWTGGAPEAVDVTYHGPGTGKVPETSELRQFKPTGSTAKWIAVKRGSDAAVFQVTAEAGTIRSHGLYVGIEQDTVRGAPTLVQALTGVDRVHLCRNMTCTEEGGQHFFEYGVVKKLDPERFQFAQAEAGAKETGAWVWSWLRGSTNQVQKFAGRVREYASESEPEDAKLPCHAFLVCWEDTEGGRRLAKEPCTGCGTCFDKLLIEDRPKAVKEIGLCQAHAAQYMCSRYSDKCCYDGCQHYGEPTNQGLKLCAAHQKRESAPKPEGRRTASRSRSRARSKSREDMLEEKEDDEYAEKEDEEMQPRDEVEELLAQARGMTTSSAHASRRSRTPRSPGNTPKASAIHRSLAKVGLLDSPETEEPNLLQEFCMRLADTKPIGGTEERTRAYLEETYMKNPEEILAKLIVDAEVEQARGQRGLTKFLTKWRSLLRELEDRKRMGDSDWSMVSDGRSQSTATPTKVPPFPLAPPGLPSPPAAEEKPPTALRIEAPAVYRGDRRAGAGEGEEGSSMTQIAKAIQHQTAELASLVKQQNEMSVHAAGTLKGLGKQAEELVFLMRACGQYQVGLGAEEHGQALANTLLATQVNASTKLRAAGFRQKMTPRLAVGIAGGHWGVHEQHCLGAADFLAFTDAELDAFSSEMKHHKGPVEQRPANPQRLDDWLARVKRQTDCWCLCYGEEWRAVKTDAMEQLATWHTGQPHRWPLTVVMDLWEELHWRFTEEMKEKLRLLKKEAGRESMSLQELRFHALLPGPDGRAWLRMPDTFAVTEPDGWVQQEVLPRIERRQERLLWNLTWQGTTRKPAQGREGAGGAETPQGGAAGSTGEADKPTAKALWGPKLTQEEVARAKERAPTDQAGNLLCWGNLCRVGCEVPNCQRSHEGLKGTFEALDECVRMQLLKRGGLKRMKAETRSSVDAKIRDLRMQIAKDKTSKIADGKKKAERAGGEGKNNQEDPGRAGGGDAKTVRFWGPPEEFEVDYTKQEDLQDLVKGPDYRWTEGVEPPVLDHDGRGGETAPEAAKSLVMEAQRLARHDVLSKLEGASDDLYAWAATRVARDPSVGLESLMMEMSTYGLGELAKEAAEILESQLGTRAGENQRLEVQETLWADGQPGQGSVRVDGKVWRSWDYGEDLWMSEELAAILKSAECGPEKRQCVTKSLAAAAVWRSMGRRPTLKEVEEKAKEFRLEQASAACEAEDAMGLPEEMVTPVEHELRTYTHDLLTVAHEKDFRSLPVFPIQELAEAMVLVLRGDYKGGLILEAVQGSSWQPGGWIIPLLIHKGHMTLLQPPDDVDLARFQRSEEHTTTPCLGFEFFWHTRHDQARTAPGKVMCRLCKPSRRAGAEEVWVRQHSCLAQLAVLAGGGRLNREVLRVVRPLDVEGLRFQEVFAGSAGLTREWQRSGVTLPPVELFQDPLNKKLPREDHDLTRPEVQKRVLDGMQHANGANVYWIASPCTSYCDWQLQNGGSRTFANPAGTGPGPVGSGPLASTEQTGNILSEFSAQAFLTALDTGNFPVAESSAPSGRYPKQWDLPAWQAILARPDAQAVDFPMCAWHLGPPDESHSYYVHMTRVVFPIHHPLAEVLRRPCPGVSATHRHVALKGCREGQTVTRCAEAGAYAQEAGGSDSRAGGDDTEGSADDTEESGQDWDPESRGRDPEELEEVEVEVDEDVRGDDDDERMESQEEPTEGECEEEAHDHEERVLSDEEAEWERNLQLLTAATDDLRARRAERIQEEFPSFTRPKVESSPSPEAEDEGGDALARSSSELRRAMDRIYEDPWGLDGDQPPTSEVATEDAEDVETPGTRHQPDRTGPVAGGGAGDGWFITWGTGEVEIRHVTPRTRLYLPSEGGDLPVDQSRLGPTRTTHLTTQWGTSVIISDDWRVEGAVLAGYGAWTGVTCFELLPEDDGNQDQEDEADDEPGGDEEEPEAEDEEGDDGECADGTRFTESSRGFRHGPPGPGPAGNTPPWRSSANRKRRRSAGGYAAKSKEAKEAAAQYLDEITDEFGSRSCDWQGLVRKGGTLLEAAGDVEEAAKALWEVREERGLDNLQGIAVKEWCQEGRLLKDFERVARSNGASTTRKGGPTLVCASLGADHGKQVRRLMKYVKDEQPTVALVEGPRGVPWELLEEQLKQEGWTTQRTTFVTTELGEGLARRRVLLIAQQGRMMVEWQNALVRAEAPVPASAILKAAPWDEERRWVKPHKLDVSGHVPRDPMLPQPVGHYWEEQDGERRIAYGMGGPIRWPLMKSGTRELEEVLVYDRKSPPGSLRRLTEEELWRLQGRTKKERFEGAIKEVDLRDLVVEGTRATGMHTATSLLAVGGYVVYMTIAGEGRAGGGPDDEGSKALAQILLWLKRWRRGELQRSSPTRAGGCEEQEPRRVWRWAESWWLSVFSDSEDEENGWRAGGRPRKKAEEVIAKAAVDLEVKEPRPQISI